MNKYKTVFIDGKQILEHRWIYEGHYECCILPFAEIHHINGDKSDNRIENLQLVTKAQHRKIDAENRKRIHISKSLPYL